MRRVACGKVLLIFQPASNGLQDAKTAERWKSGMPDLTNDVVKWVRRFGRSHLKQKCYAVKSVLCYYCCRRYAAPVCCRFHPSWLM